MTWRDYLHLIEHAGACTKVTADRIKLESTGSILAVSWLKVKEQRERVAFVFGGLVVSVAGIWAILTFYSTTVSSELVISLCAEKEATACTSGSRHVGLKLVVPPDIINRCKTLIRLGAKNNGEGAFHSNA